MSASLLLRRRAALMGSFDPLDGVNIGDAFCGGFFVGIIDTIKYPPIVSDASQTGLRAACIVSPKSLENPSLQWKTTNDAGPAATNTLWDGPSATAAMAAFGATYPAASYCAGLSYPADGASSWWLPPMDVLELAYRNLRPSSESNDTNSYTGDFPPYAHASGQNPSSDPQGAAYTTSVPGQTSVAAFKSGGAQALGVSGSNVYLWSATQYNATNAWLQGFSGTNSGRQGTNTKDTSFVVRPFRWLVL